jgi:DNA ligase-associated metallophosphoesterase
MGSWFGRLKRAKIVFRDKRNADGQTCHSDAASVTQWCVVHLMAGQPWSWQRERLQFLPQRALWRPEGRVLLVADLHLGKAEAFQAHGIPLPSDADCGTINPLLDLCHRLRPKQLFVLGDLIHAREGVTPRLREVLRVLPELTGALLQLIGGNHDRHTRFEGLSQQPSQRLGQLWLSHAPEAPPQPDLLNVCGHLHPMSRVRGAADQLRLPCFAYDQEGPRLVIPAFGELTGGHDCGHRYRQWLVADEAIVPWFNPPLQPNGRWSA